MRFILRYVLCLFLILIACTTLPAQIIPPQDAQANDEVQSFTPVGIDYSILPILGYSTDWGLYGGALLQRINYADGIRPFLSNMQADFTLSTRGNIITEFTYERTKTFGTPLRTYVEFVGQRFMQSHYFGIGNRASFSENLFDEKYYFFERREFFLDFRGRRQAARFGNDGFLDLMFAFNISYLNGLTREGESLYREERPFGFGKSWTSKPGIGFIVDSRDSEFNPGRGVRYEFLYYLSDPLFGSDYAYSDFMLDLRHYYELFPNLVVAHNLKAEAILGNAPFWDLKMLGGETGLRGFYLERFRGDHSILSMLELRTWLFSVWDGNIRVGGQLFWDSGRVYSGSDSNALLDNWQHSFGAGSVFSLFNPDLILRADLGISEEAVGIYFGAGYVF